MHYITVITFHTDVIVFYITVQISIDKLNAESQSICFNFDITHTFIDSNFITDHSHLFSKNLQIHDIISNNSDELISSKCINLQLYIHSNNSKSKIFVACKTYVINELNVDILINMNIMQSEDIMLNCSKNKLIMNSYYDFTTFFSKVNDTKTVIYHYEMT